MYNLQELKDYLNTRNLFNRYTWTNSSAHFKTLTTSEGMDLQIGYKKANLPVDAKMWIDYVDAADEFVLNINYFTHTGDAITKEEFVNQIPITYPARKYNLENRLKWVRRTDIIEIEYDYIRPSVPIIVLPMAKILKLSTSVSTNTPPPILTPY